MWIEFKSITGATAERKIPIVKMGKLLSKIFGNKEMRILMLGLDAAGKTSE